MKKLTPEGDRSPSNEGFVKEVAVDLVIFGFHDHQLKILLLKHYNTNLYALPGGYVGKTENLEDAARRVLEARTSLKGIYMEQFHVFGDFKRNDPSTIKAIMLGRDLDLPLDHWVFGRFFSVGYYSLVDFTKVIPKADSLSESCDWYEIKDLPNLILDHRQIIDKALETLQEDLDKKLVGFNLLPETFTMNELQTLYETILNKKLLRTNFQRKILSLNILERIEKKWTGGSHKAPYLYRFNNPSTVS